MRPVGNTTPSLRTSTTGRLIPFPSAATSEGGGRQISSSGERTSTCCDCSEPKKTSGGFVFKKFSPCSERTSPPSEGTYLCTAMAGVIAFGGMCKGECECE